MRRALLFLLASAVAGRISAAPATAKSHANALAARIASVDPANKILVVRDAAGSETRLVWTRATRMSGGALKAGEKVTIRWVARDGKKIATVLRVGEPNAPPTPPALRSPTAPPRR